MKQALKGVMLVAGLCAWTNATATTISHSAFFSMPSKPVSAYSNTGPGINLGVDNKIVRFPLFDSTQGTLQSARIDFDTDWIIAGDTLAYSHCYSKPGSTCGQDFTFKGEIRNEMSVRLTAPIPNLIGEFQASAKTRCDKSGGHELVCADGFGRMRGFDGSLSVSQSDLSDLSGSGKASLLLRRWVYAEIDVCRSQGNEGAAYTQPNCQIDNQVNKWFGNLSVTYTYRQAQNDNGDSGIEDGISVPAPGTLAIFGAGLACLGILSRRRFIV
jgi:hypothetical protein